MFCCFTQLAARSRRCFIFHTDLYFCHCSLYISHCNTDISCLSELNYFLRSFVPLVSNPWGASAYKCVLPSVPLEYVTYCSWRRSSVNFFFWGGRETFIYEKLTKCPNYTWELPEKLAECPNCYDICPKKSTKFPTFRYICRKNTGIWHDNCPKKYFRFFFFGGGTCQSPPVSYAHRPNETKKANWTSDGYMHPVHSLRMPLNIKTT